MPKTTNDTPKPEKEPRYQLADMIQADKALPKLARTIGAYLAAMCDVRQPFAFAMQEHLAEKFGTSIRSVSRAVKALDDRGYLKRRRSGTNRGDGWGSNNYHPAWDVLTNPTVLKPLPKATSQNCLEADAAGSERCPVAQPKLAGGDQPKLSDGAAKNGGSNQPKLAGILLEGYQLGDQSGNQEENCAATRTGPPGSSNLSGSDWGLFLASHAWKGAGHNGRPDEYFKPIFLRARRAYHLDEIIHHANLRAEQAGDNLWSAGHFLVGEYEGSRRT